ncbi:MAG: hypothetical protein SFV51_01260 [Bryobacteraceae bacterium]|nr:hypothetical protein [Bryobacteraceae bacterium]
MRRLALVIWTGLAVTGGTLGAGNIEGTIRVTRRLTRQRVTPVVPAYHRGVVAPAEQPSAGWDREELDRVAVYLESSAELPSTPVIAQLEQRGRRFLSHTLVVPAGSTVSFPNRDPIFHNVFSLSRAKSFDLGNYRQNETRSVVFTKAGVVQVYCHLHPNMAASIVVTPNKWAAKPSPAGAFVLEAVPPGRHAVVVWHPSAGSFRKNVQVGGGAVQLDFEIPVDERQP